MPSQIDRPYLSAESENLLMSFKEMKVSPFLLKPLRANGIDKPTPIQEQAIPAIMSHNDVLGIAQTGSGKTLSYVLPVLTNLKGKTSSKSRHISVLVLVPTRELAVQVHNVFHEYSKFLSFHCKSMAVQGGSSINPQMKAMKDVNILVATPGRFLDLLEMKALKLDALRVLILDEADKMLNMGFKKEMTEIFSQLPTHRQNLLFSATLSPEVQNIEEIILKEPMIIKVEAEKESVDLIQQRALLTSPERKGPLLRYLIKQHNMQQVLIFTSSIYQADLVTDKLNKNGIQAMAIHGKKSQSGRTKALDSFKTGKVQALVATDLLSRGIDIAFLPYVINYELPRSPKVFIHRIGRTGRAENPGEAISLLTEDDLHHFKIIQKKMKKTVEIVDSAALDLHGQKK